MVGFWACDDTDQRRYYQFRDPFEVYREFFAAGDPFEEFGLRSPFMRTGFGFGGSPFMGSFGGGFPGFGADSASSFGRSSGGTTRIFVSSFSSLSLSLSLLPSALCREYYASTPVG